MLLRGFLATTAVYVAADVLHWAAVLRHGRMRNRWEMALEGRLDRGDVCHVRVGDRLDGAEQWPAARAQGGRGVAAAVLVAGLARTAMATLGMWQFLVWDHDGILVETAFFNVIFALVCIVPACVVAQLSLSLFGRGTGGSAKT